jgi:hypothetical protein
LPAWQRRPNRRRYRLGIYSKIAKKSVWLGSVEALDKQAAIEKGAQEFKTEAWRLYAVERR